MDTFLLGPVPEIENDSQTNKCVLFVKYVTKALLTFLSWCYKKVKGSRSLIFALFIIIMMFITPTILFGDVYKVGYTDCINGSYAISAEFPFGH